MNILKGVAETLLGRESETFEEKKEKFERLEQSENKESTVVTAETRMAIMKDEVVEQTIRPIERTEVQPVISLEREQTEVHEVIQPIREREILPQTFEERQLPTVEKEEVRESEEKFKQEYNELTEGFKSSVSVEDLKKERVVKQPIINEKIHKKVIEEIQPVIHKETIAPHVIKQTQQVHEKIVEAPHLYTEDYSQKPDLEKLKAEGVDVESYSKKPILEESIKPIQRTEIQPVIQLEREQTELHEVIQPISEKEVLPITVEERELPTVEKERVVESQEQFKKEYEALTEKFKSSVSVGEIEHQKIVKAPVVNEIVHKRVIEEIQPVIHKETLVPHLVKETVPIHEKLVEAPKLVVEELPEKNLGTTFIEEPAIVTNL